MEPPIIVAPYLQLVACVALETYLVWCKLALVGPGAVLDSIVAEVKIVVD